MEISNIYNKVLEFEGLLLLLKSEENSSLRADIIFTRIREKINEIDSDVDGLKISCEGTEERVEETATEVTVESTAPDETAEAEEVIVETTVGDAYETSNEDAGQQVAGGNSQVEAAVSEEAENSQVEVAVPEVAENLQAESAEPEVTVSAPGEDATESSQQSIADSAEYEERADADIPYQPTAVTPPPAPAVNIYIDVENDGVDVNKSAFASKAHGDIRKAFTLNDNYKFRRTLFHNSQAEFSNALSAIDRMTSTFDAEEYFYTTLNWDRENPDVKEFMNIVSAYFLGK